MLWTSWPDSSLERSRMADKPGLEFDHGFNRLPVLNRFADLEHRQRLHNIQENGIDGQDLPGADPSSETKDNLVRIWLRDGSINLSCGRQEAIGVEGHWVWVDGRVVGEPPFIVKGLEKEIYICIYAGGCAWRL
jgi:hypothetical protein